MLNEKLDNLFFSYRRKLYGKGDSMHITTLEGSGLGSVLDDVKRFCKNANLKEGLAIRNVRLKKQGIL